MCDRYSSSYGYICQRCFDELVELGIDVDVDEFMDSYPDTMRHIDERGYRKWDAVFPDSRDV